MTVALTPTDPSTWAPLPLDLSTPRTITLSGVTIPCPRLPDGRGMSLADWVALVEQHREVLQESHESRASLDRYAWRGQAQKVADLLTTTQVPLATLDQALNATVRQTPAASEELGHAQLLAWELIVGMLLAAGAPIGEGTVLNALGNPNQALALRVLRACPPGAPREAFEGQDARYLTPSTWLHSFLESPRRPERAQVLDALLATGHPLDVGPAGPDNSLLEMAALHDDVPSAHRLIQAGAPVNVAHRTQGTTALAHALAQGGLEMIDLLLAHGATVSALPRSLLETLVAPDVVDGRNLATLQVLAQRLERSEVRPDGQPWWTPEDEVRALAALGRPDACDRSGPGQNACKNWLEARALRALSTTSVGPSLTTVNRGRARL